MSKLTTGLCVISRTTKRPLSYCDRAQRQQGCTVDQAIVNSNGKGAIEVFQKKKDLKGYRIHYSLWFVERDSFVCEWYLNLKNSLKLCSSFHRLMVVIGPGGRGWFVTQRGLSNCPGCEESA